MKRKLGFSIGERERDGRKRKEKKREELQSCTWRTRETPTPTWSLQTRRFTLQTSQAHGFHFPVYSTTSSRSVCFPRNLRKFKLHNDFEFHALVCFSFPEKEWRGELNQFVFGFFSGFFFIYLFSWNSLDSQTKVWFWWLLKNKN